jgi:hypothetical protein
MNKTNFMCNILHTRRVVARIRLKNYENYEIHNDNDENR